MANDILLQEGHPVDENLRPLKIGGKSSSLELSQYENGSGARITGDLEVTGNIMGNIKDIVLDLTTINSTDLTIDDTGTITLDSDDGVFKFLLAGDADDLCTLTVAANGATTLATADSDGTVGDLILDVDGTLKLDAASIAGGAGVQFLLNGTLVGDMTGHHVATNFVLYENVGASTDDFFSISTYENGATTLKTLDGAGADAHMQFQADGHILFQSPAGFTKIPETFSDDSVIGSGGTDDTHIDFRVTNKISLAVTGNITNLNLIFPAVSGNFLLLLTYDGDHTITNYKVYEADESAADGDADVFWPGGTKPDNTASGVDILSFFYDATDASDKCYGVASLAFATP